MSRAFKRVVTRRTDGHCLPGLPTRERELGIFSVITGTQHGQFWENNFEKKVHHMFLGKKFYLKKLYFPLKKFSKIKEK